MTPDDLLRLEQLEQQATPAPWSVRGTPDMTPVEVMPDVAGFDGCGWEDAQLIAAVRNALPALLSEVKQLRAEHSRLRRSLEDAKHAMADVRHNEIAGESPRLGDAIHDAEMALAEIPTLKVELVVGDWQAQKESGQ